MLNRIIIQGKIGRDPELRHTQTGIPVTSFSVAVDRDFKDKSTGEKETDWINVIVWRSSAEFITRYGRKGSNVLIEGRLQIREWTDRDGNKRRNAEVQSENIYILDKRNRDEATEYSSPADNVQEYDEAEEDGELPFK